MQVAQVILVYWRENLKDSLPLQTLVEIFCSEEMITHWCYVAWIIWLTADEKHFKWTVFNLIFVLHCSKEIVWMEYMLVLYIKCVYVAGSYCQYADHHRSGMLVFCWWNYWQGWSYRLLHTWGGWLRSSYVMHYLFGDCYCLQDI